MESSSEANEELRARIRQQQVVAEIGQQALDTGDIDQLMHDAEVAVAETLDDDYAKVLGLLPGGDEVLLRQGVGWREGLVGNATVSTDLDSQAGYTLLSEEPIIVDDLRTEERFSEPELLTSHDVASGISVVIGSVDDLQLQIEENATEITAEPLPRVEGDPGKLRQVFQNLLDNAIEYSGDEPPRVHVAAERDGPDWRISVSDEGIGIDPDDADRIFEAFQRLHTHDEQRGTGIDLALCRRIVERHGGEIWVESEPGEGATFSFTLPAAGEHDE